MAGQDGIAEGKVIVRSGPMVERLTAVAAVVVLVGGSLLVLAPFAAPLLWGVILAYSSWGPYEWLVRRLRGRRNLAAALMVLLSAAVLLGPLVYAGMGLAGRADDAAAFMQRVVDKGMPPLPAWIRDLPVVGPSIGTGWDGLTSDNAELISQLRKLAAPGAKVLLKAGVAVLQGLLQLTLSILIAFFLYRGGQAAVAWLRGGMVRIAGDRADRLLALIGGTVRGVVYGILGTALAQGTLVGLGLWLAGVPGAAALGFLTFFLSALPMGPVLVWLPAALWLFHEGATGWAIFLVVWGAGVVSMVDNVIKPLLISQGSAMPFLLVMLGVLGGAIGFGPLGVFIGPTLLALTYSILREWAQPQDTPAPPTLA